MTVSCRDVNTLEDKDLEGDISEVSLPNDFLDFLKKFSEDSSFQIESIQWPLEKQLALEHPEDDLTNVMINVDEWKLQHPFNDMNGTYDQQFINFNGIVTEMTTDNTGQYTMIRRFAKIDNKWKLIFYKEMGL
jgi:hypothetical protein